jgi:hypothetical protein
MRTSQDVARHLAGVSLAAHARRLMVCVDSEVGPPGETYLASDPRWSNSHRTEEIQGPPAGAFASSSLARGSHVFKF